MAANQSDNGRSIVYSQTLITILQLLRGDEGVKLNLLYCSPKSNGEPRDIVSLLVLIEANYAHLTYRLCELWSVAAVALRSLSSEKKRILLSHRQISSEVLWGRAVATCDDPMYYEHIADAMTDDEVALVAGKRETHSDVRLRTLRYV